MWGPPSHARPHNPLPGTNAFKRPTGKTPLQPPRAPPSPQGSHPGPRLLPSQPAPAAPVAAPWCRPGGAGRAALLRSPHPTAEGTNRPVSPHRRDRLFRGARPSQPCIPAPALPARQDPTGKGGWLYVSAHQLVPNPPPGEPPRWSPELRHQSGLQGCRAQACDVKG